MRNLAAPAWLFAVGLLAVSPAALAAQNDTGQPVGQEDNTSYGTTSAEFLLLGAGARGAALGGSFAAIATDISSLYYNPAGAALIEKAGLTIGTYDYVADTRYTLGRPGLSLQRREPEHRLPAGHLRLPRPAGLHRGPAGWDRGHLLGEPDLHRAHLRPELLRPLQRGAHGQVRGRPAGHGERECVRGGLRDQLPRHAEQPPGEVQLRAGQPGVEPDLRGHRAAAGAGAAGAACRGRTRCPRCRSRPIC